MSVCANPGCGADLTGRRRQTRYCDGKCRAEASRLRRLRESAAVDGYASLRGYQDRVPLRAAGGVDTGEAVVPPLPAGETAQGPHKSPMAADAEGAAATFLARVGRIRRKRPRVRDRDR
jgi:hypothetical protein